MQNTNVPTDWKTKKLKQVLSLLKDGTHGTHKDCVQGKFLLSAKDVVEGRVLCSEDSRIISDEDFNSIHARYKLQNRDIVLTIVGTVGRSAIINNYNQEYTFQRSVAILRPSEFILPEFLHAQIQSTSFQNELKKRQSVSAQPGVYLEDLGSVPCVVPPIKEQKKIAEILGTWDRAIEELTDLIVEKKELKRGLMQRLLTGTQRLPGFAKPWKKVKINTFLREISEKTTLNNQHKVLSVTKNGVCSQEDYFEKQIASENNIGYKILRKHNLVFSPMNLWMGSLGFSDYDIGIVSPAYKIFIVDESVTDYRFLKYFMITPQMIYVYKVNSEIGASIVRRNLDLDGLLSSFVHVPEFEEQKAIADILSKADSEIDLLNQRLDVLKEQKRGLMQKLLTGEIRVKVDME